MTITTKFNIGDVVYLMAYNDIVTVTIKAVKIVVEGNNSGSVFIDVGYYVDKYTGAHLERQLFPTKQALIDHLNNTSPA